MQRFPVLQTIPGYFVGIGLLPEHAPDFAKRASLGSAAPFSAQSPNEAAHITVSAAFAAMQPLAR
jgi:hypothetical protein